MGILNYTLAYHNCKSHKCSVIIFIYALLGYFVLVISNTVLPISMSYQFYIKKYFERPSLFKGYSNMSLIVNYLQEGSTSQKKFTNLLQI